MGGLFLFYLTSCTYQKKSYNGDNESGLYYLQSRYYDPEIGRFINADALVATGQGLLGNNMFAYCLNNPANYIDPSGNVALVDDVVIFSAMAVVIALILLPPPPVLDVIATELAQLVTTTIEKISYAANILTAKTKGKERVKDTGLAQESDEEVSSKAHDKSLPKSEQHRYQKEEKARGLRNRQKRMALYK